MIATLLAIPMRKPEKEKKGIEGQVTIQNKQDIVDMFWLFVFGFLVFGLIWIWFFLFLRDF